MISSDNWTITDGGQSCTPTDLSIDNDNVDENTASGTVV
jgi:hypothetical protein